jgi:hypothetical protein
MRVMTVSNKIRITSIPNILQLSDFILACEPVNLWLSYITQGSTKVTKRDLPVLAFNTSWLRTFAPSLLSSQTCRTDA